MPVQDADLVVVSNRGPLTIDADEEGEDRYQRGGGGLVSGMQTALSESPGAVWVCAAMRERERSIARGASGRRLSSVPPAAEALHGDFDVVMLPIDAPTYRAAYNGIANATLWFVLHMLFDSPRRPVFDARWRRQWAAYQRYNLAFAETVTQIAADNGTVMVQDYHLFLLPALIRRQRPDLRIGFFTHTPWVGPDYFSALPADVCRELLEGVSGADVVGFHTRRWADDFEACCESLLGARSRARVEVFGLRTDARELNARAHRRDVESALRDLNVAVGDRLVVGRVDRAELSKNVLRGLLAFRELLVRYSEWQGRVVHIVFDNPSREDLVEYRDYTRDVQELAENINDELGTEDWTPVLLSIEHDYPAALATLRRSDVLLVNPIRDGMNLVIFEGIVLSERSAVAVVSENAGAAEVLGSDALLVNPFDVSQTADALHRALSMPVDERAARTVGLRAAATQLPPTAWFAAQLEVVRDSDSVSG